MTTIWMERWTTTKLTWSPPCSLALLRYFRDFCGFSGIYNWIQAERMRHDIKIPKSTYEEWREFADDEPSAAPCDHWGNGGGYKLEQRVVELGVNQPRSPRKKAKSQLSMVWHFLILLQKKSKTGAKPLNKAPGLYAKSITMAQNGNFRSTMLRKRKKVPKQGIPLPFQIQLLFKNQMAILPMIMIMKICEMISGRESIFKTSEKF